MVARSRVHVGCLGYGVEIAAYDSDRSLQFMVDVVGHLSLHQSLFLDGMERDAVLAFAAFHGLKPCVVNVENLAGDVAELVIWEVIGLFDG